MRKKVIFSRCGFKILNTLYDADGCLGVMDNCLAILVEDDIEGQKVCNALLSPTF